MKSDRSLKTAVCFEDERLLIACQEALEKWRSRRENIATSRPSNKALANDLLRLQADYAKAYARLEKHEDNCEICCFVSKIGGRDYASIAMPVLARKRV
jgi:hypothetical protein